MHRRVIQACRHLTQTVSPSLCCCDYDPNDAATWYMHMHKLSISVMAYATQQFVSAPRSNPTQVSPGTRIPVSQHFTSPALRAGCAYQCHQWYTSDALSKHALGCFHSLHMWRLCHVDSPVFGALSYSAGLNFLSVYAALSLKHHTGSQPVAVGLAVSTVVLGAFLVRFSSKGSCHSFLLWQY